MGKKYKNPPLVEALCEFHFISAQPWDPNLSKLIYEKVKDEFPEEQQQIGIGVQLRAMEKGVEQKIESVPPRIQFHKKDRTALIQIAPDLLVINRLKPYSTWHEFKPMIMKNFLIYQGVVRPKGFKRIGLRYINIVEFDKSKLELKDYFRFYPYIPDGLPQLCDSFLNRVEFPYSDNKERLMLTLATVISKKPNVHSILFDLEYVMVTPEYVPLHGVSDWLEKAHESIEKAFEASITEKAREIFEEEES